METLSLNSAVIEKTRELCSLILESSDYKENVVKIEAFFADDDAQKAYRSFSELGQELHQKQHAGELSEEDVKGYEEQKATLHGNPVIDGFMQSETVLNSIVQQVAKHVGKTLELGHLPEPEDLQESDCCSSGGCGCD